ncbi:hypothetical protein [Parolsenella catena]|uniref:hypothetical protein n=1 Tax=Parolsenella catena TaxID=2003188 RepID=UPI002FDCD4C7
MRAGQSRIPERRRPFFKRASAPKADHARKVILCAALVAVLAGGGVLAASLLGNRGFTGAILGRAQEGKTREQIQAELNQEVEDNMMTVSVLPSPRLSSSGVLTVGFENDRSNKFNQRFTLTQGDEVIYESQAIEPGERIDAVRVDDVREGEAVVEVQAVEPDGESDHGSPTAVQVSVVSEAETSGAAETSGT